jgi:hypothetical protein
MASARNRIECLKGWIKQLNITKKKVSVIVFDDE